MLYSIYSNIQIYVQIKTIKIFFYYGKSLGGKTQFNATYTKQCVIGVNGSMENLKDHSSPVVYGVIHLNILVLSGIVKTIGNKTV